MFSTPYHYYLFLDFANTTENPNFPTNTQSLLFLNAIAGYLIEFIKYAISGGDHLKKLKQSCKTAVSMFVELSWNLSSFL